MAAAGAALTSATATPSPWADAVLAAALLAVHPAACGGAVLRAPAGPVRERWLSLLQRLLGPARAPLRMPLHIRDDRLLGGLDLAATLRAGRPVAEPGLLARADGRLLCVAMAERLAATAAARLTAALDTGEVRVERDGLALCLPTRFGVLALDEGLVPDEQVPAALAERAALWLDLSALPPREAVGDFGPDAAEIDAARRRLPAVRADEATIAALCGVAAQLGIASLRAPLLALAVARLHAALCGRDAVEHDDAVAAARLVLAPRATMLPAPPGPADERTEEGTEEGTDDSDPDGTAHGDHDADAPLPPAPAADDASERTEPTGDALGEVVLQAAVAAIPAGLLARLKAERAGRERARGGGGKAGDWQRGQARGRPAGVMRSDPRGGQRLDLVATLRAAAPWQRLRRGGAAVGGPAPQDLRVRVRPDDFHVTRLRQRRETTTIFVVDASGSAALHRLAEAKGAVELLLADCYVRRDRVAVLAFRGRAAELLLPPTRSLVRAKRSLAGLPGGGGTPLAAAVDAAAELARNVRRRGETPVLVLLTDGRANVARDGTGGRARAEEDALAAARRLGAEGLAVLLVDTGPQPQGAAARLAAAMRATYLPLPHAGAAELSSVVQAHARAGR